MKAGVEIAFVERAEWAAQKRRDVLGLDSVDGRARQILVKGSELVAAAEQDVGGELDLRETPVVSRAEHLDDRAEALREIIQLRVQPADVELLGQLLSFGEILEFDKAVVLLRKADSGLAQRAGERVVAVEVHFQTEGCPGWHTDKAQSELIIDEVEVVVRTAAAVAAHVSSPRVLVVPGLVRRAAFHRRKNMHQSRVRAAGFEQFCDTLVFSEISEFADELNFEATFRGQLLGVFADALGQRLGPLGVVEQPNVTRVQEARHRVTMADLRDRCCDDDAIPTVKDSGDLWGVTAGECAHGRRAERTIAARASSKTIGRRIGCRPFLVPACPG